MNGDGVEEFAFGGAERAGGDSINVYEPDGPRVWQNFDTVEAQQIAFGDFRPDLPGLEVAGLDRVDRSANGKDAVFLIDSAAAPCGRRTVPPPAAGAPRSSRCTTGPATTPT